MNYIVVVKQQIDDLLLKLKAQKNIYSVSFSKDEKGEEKVKNLKIKIELFDRFKAEKLLQ